MVRGLLTTEDFPSHKHPILHDIKKKKVICLNPCSFFPSCYPTWYFFLHLKKQCPHTFLKWECDPQHVCQGGALACQVLSRSVEIPMAVNHRHLPMALCQRRSETWRTLLRSCMTLLSAPCTLDVLLVLLSF